MLNIYQQVQSRKINEYGWTRKEDIEQMQVEEEKETYCKSFKRMNLPKNRA